MKRLSLSLALVVAALAPLAAAAQQTPTTSRSSATSPRAATPSAVERDLQTFSDWVDQKVSAVDAGARRQLPQLMADFDRQSARLDRATDSLSARSKREYANQKTRYKTWAAGQQRLDTTVRNNPEAATAFQRRMLGEKVTISTTRAAELPDLFGHFLESTRAQRRTWTAADWTAADLVLERLNARYEQLRDQFDVDEKLRVRSLQGEFRALEKAKDMKDIFNGM